MLAGALVLGLYAVGWAAVLRVPSQYPTIQAGIDAAVEGDTVLVADGTYTGDGNRDLDFGGVNMVVMSEHGPDVTIIDCEGDSLDPHRGFYLHSGKDSSSVVQGFSITNGYALDDGGAIRCSNSSPTIRGNTIMGNTAAHFGGGIHCEGDAYPVVVENTISGNTAGSGGGGIFCFDYSGVDIVANIITDNVAGGGAGIGCSMESDVAVERCVISANRASYSGGGIVLGSWCSGSIEGSTITQNRAGDHGGGIVCSMAAASVENCILYGDSAETGREIWLEGSSYGMAGISVSYSDVQGGSSAVYVGSFSLLYWDEGNIDADPLFVPGPHGEYYLSQIAAGQQEDSPCVDAGDPQSPVPDGTTRTDEVPDSLPVDMGYHYRIGSVVDVGREDRERTPAVFQCLAQNYPNPFSSITTIRYALPEPSHVSLGIYDIRGALVRPLALGRQSAGRHQVDWDGRDQRGHRVGSGVYFCHLSVGDHTETKRMVLLR